MQHPCCQLPSFGDRTEMSLNQADFSEERESAGHIDFFGRRPLLFLDETRKSVEPIHAAQFVTGKWSGIRQPMVASNAADCRGSLLRAELIEVAGRSESPQLRLPAPPPPPACHGVLVLPAKAELRDRRPTPSLHDPAKRDPARTASSRYECCYKAPTATPNHERVEHEIASLAIATKSSRPHPPAAQPSGLSPDSLIAS